MTFHRPDHDSAHPAVPRRIVADMTAQDDKQPAPHGGSSTYAETYRLLLLNAISALTEAARLPRPRFVFNEDGTRHDDSASSADQSDWAEFVTLALASATANVGGIEAILAGRAGSWEADGLRQLLYSTVGVDEANLWAHRTETLDITIFVDEILFDYSDRHHLYHQAQNHISAQHETVSKAWDPNHEARHLWIYDRRPDGQMTPREPAAPPWTENLRQTATPPMFQAFNAAGALDAADALGCASATDHDTVYIPKSRHDAAEYLRLVDGHEARLAAIDDLEEQLDAHRLQEWDTFGQALRARIEAIASTLHDLDVDVRVTIDTETFRDEDQRHRAPLDQLRDRLIETAISQTPLPHDDVGGLLDNLGPARRPHTTRLQHTRRTP